MPKISRTKEDKIKEAILSFLFQHAPKAIFTAKISQELLRDEEYIKRLMFELEEKNLVVSVKKNPQGKEYSKRIRWRLSDKVYKIYKGIQINQLKPEDIV